jgi:DNA-directed RNA polymerase I, II, and III subunit RPABC2
MDDEEYDYNDEELGYDDEDEDYLVGEDIEDLEEELEDEDTELKTGLEDISEPTIIPEASNKIKVTSKYLSKYEKTRILGTRALQISLGSPPTVDIGNLTDAYDIALLELRQKKIPIIIRRYLPNNTFEDWNISELNLID